MTPTNTSTHSNIVSREDGKIPLYLEGPCGIVKHFPNLTRGDFARVLLVADGIGATFIVPLYKSIVHDNSGVKVEMVWAVRGAGDATWAVTGTNRGKSIMDDENVHIFLTGDILESGGSGDGTMSTSSKPRCARSSRTGGSSGEGRSSMAGEDSGDEEVEMSSMYRDRKRNKYTSQHNRKRPDLRKIVDDLFKNGADERVAIVVCGPQEMAKELRDHVVRGS
jgi:ferredoxin-NADP reductase